MISLLTIAVFSAYSSCVILPAASCSSRAVNSSLAALIASVYFDWSVTLFVENLNISVFALLMACLKELNTGIICLITGPANASPVLLRAAFMLSNEPVKVWLALKAFSPNVSNIISENISKLI